MLVSDDRFSNTKEDGTHNMLARWKAWNLCNGGSLTDLLLLREIEGKRKRVTDVLMRRHRTADAERYSTDMHTSAQSHTLSSLMCSVFHVISVL